MVPLDMISFLERFVERFRRPNKTALSGSEQAIRSRTHGIIADSLQLLCTDTHVYPLGHVFSNLVELSASLRSSSVAAIRLN
jgi:hypothetical protein